MIARRVNCVERKVDCTSNLLLYSTPAQPIAGIVDGQDPIRALQSITALPGTHLIERVPNRSVEHALSFIQEFCPFASATATPNPDLRSSTVRIEVTSLLETRSRFSIQNSIPNSQSQSRSPNSHLQLCTFVLITRTKVRVICKFHHHQKRQVIHHLLSPHPSPILPGKGRNVLVHRSRRPQGTPRPRQHHLGAIFVTTVFRSSTTMSWSLFSPFRMT